ncbi:MAG TPA: glycosyltransferase family 4 protein, partial [Anaerolineales bacterium]|nr:glycosyltransferase family 4 protein [Anaerolineales bacterium]
IRVAVSAYTRELAQKNYPEEILVIPNGVDVKAVRPERIQVNTPPVIVFAGRLMPQKAPLQLVQSLKEITDIPWRCVIIGDGTLLPDLKKWIIEANLEDRFLLTGWITPQEVMQWFDRSDILFMPSLSEGLPVVGVQALAKGLAIVASRVGGFVDLVDDAQNGYLVERSAISHFSLLLRNLLEDPNRLLSFRNASLEKAKSFEIDRIVDQYENIFLGIIRQKSDLVETKFEI